jgi:hypothetical protein
MHHQSTASEINSTAKYAVKAATAAWISCSEFAARQTHNMQEPLWMDQASVPAGWEALGYVMYSRMRAVAGQTSSNRRLPHG